MVAWSWSRPYNHLWAAVVGLGGHTETPRVAWLAQALTVAEQRQSLCLFSFSWWTIQSCSSISAYLAPITLPEFDIVNICSEGIATFTNLIKKLIK